MAHTTLRLSSDADLVGAIPHLLGFHPAESVTLLTTEMVVGGRGVGPAARLDLAGAGGYGGEGYVQEVVDRFARDRLGILAVVVHTGAPLAEARGSVHVTSAVERVRAADDERVGAWLVAADGWQRLPGHAPFRDRGGPRPLEELMSSNAVADLVLSGSAPVAGRDGLGVRREPSTDEGRRLVGAVDARMQRRPPGIGLTVRAYDDLVSRRTLGRPGPLIARDHDLLARLLVGIERLDVRDAVLTRVLVGTGLPVEMLSEPEIAAPLWTGGGHETAERRLPLETIARLAPDGAAAPALAMLAMLAWRRGDGARAAVLAELALLDRPGYALALLVADLQASGTAPRRGLGGPDLDPFHDLGDLDDEVEWLDLTAFDDVLDPLPEDLVDEIDDSDAA